MKNYLTIKAKAWLIFSLSTFVAIGLIIFTIFYLYQNLYLDNEKERLSTKASSLQEAHGTLSEDAFEERVAWTMETSVETIMTVDDPMMLGSALPLDDPEEELMINKTEREQLMNGETVTIVREHESLQTYILGVAAPVITDGFLDTVILVYRPITDVNETLIQITPLLVVTGVIFLLILFVLTHRVQRQYIEPIVDLEKSAKKLAEGKFKTEIPVKVNNELSRLADAFKFLAASLSDEDDKKRSFIQNISHELRTPLSYIKGYSELLHDANVNEDPALYKDYANIIYKEANRMNRLVDQLISLTKLEQTNTDSITVSPLVLSEILNEAARSTQVMRDQKNQSLTANTDDDLIVNGDEDKLLQVFINILDNASTYSPEYGQITISSYREKNTAVVEITDNGEGIDKDDLPYVTERFYRADKSRARAKGGVGIGLSIVSQIINLHDGSLSFDSEKGIGTTVTISLPLYNDI